MELNISDALHQNGAKFPFAFEENFQNFEYLGRLISFAESVSFAGEYTYDGKSLFVTGRIRTAFHSNCAKCNDSFVEAFSCEYEEVFHNSALEFVDEDEECYTFSGDSVKLDKSVMDNILLQMPMTSYCKEDCKGICPVCGTNLNYSTCNCKQYEDKSPFNELLNIKFDNND